MAKNNFQTLSQIDATNLAGTMVEVMSADPAAFGLTPGQVVELEAAYENYKAKCAAFSHAELQYHAAASSKANSRTALAKVMATVAKLVYANPLVSDENIVRSGLSIPNKPRRGAAKVPGYLSAKAVLPNGVLLQWQRNGNPYGVNFFIEHKRVGEPWTMIAATQASKILLKGYPPGETVCFRVAASRRNITSQTSNHASIYSLAANHVMKAA